MHNIIQKHTIFLRKQRNSAIKQVFVVLGWKNGRMPQTSHINDTTRNKKKNKTKKQNKPNKRKETARFPICARQFTPPYRQYIVVMMRRLGHY